MLIIGVGKALSVETKLKHSIYLSAWIGNRLGIRDVADIHEAYTGVEQRNRRLCHPSGHQRSQVTTDRQTFGKASLQSGAGRAEDGPSHRQDHNGSVYSGLVLVSLINSP